MMCRVRAPLACVLAAASSAIAVPAFAADLPEIKISSSNQVPECMTPGRLMSFLEGRNGKLDEKFSTIAADYMRVGEELKVRWDIAFFQMLLETGNLTFTGDVDKAQNNFAGLGATGKKEPGETFADVPTGVKAHLQHILMYSGETVDAPVAERTRKVQEWGVLTSWQKTISGPMTYTQLARKWAPGSKSYSSDIHRIEESFLDGQCSKPDPKPEMMALVKTGAAPQEKSASAEAPEKAAPSKGVELARRANEEARASGEVTRSGLGATSLAASTGAAKSATTEESATKAQPAVTILNAPKAEPAIEKTETPVAPPAATAESEKKAPEAKVQTASFGAGLLNALGIRSNDKKVAESKPAEKTAGKATASGCKVWTASYGGSHAVIIKANADAQDNFTVLDVNEGSEKREADAYIAAYAKGGQLIGEFNSSNQALDKAFELCPEG